MQSNKDHYNPNEEFTWREVGRGLKDWKVGFSFVSAPEKKNKNQKNSTANRQTYISGTIQFSGNVTLYGLSTFM